MSNEKSAYVELLKYPIVILSILLALIVAKHALGITFGPVKEITKNGVSFDTEVKGGMADLSSRLNEATKEIDELRKLVPVPANQADAIKASVSVAAQTVSEQTAQLSKLSVSSADSTTTRGFMFIGNYDGSTWSEEKLASPDTGQPIATPPDQIQPGSIFKVTDNMVVREGLPANTPKYYRDQKSLGTIISGTKIKIMGTPTGINRGFAMQYWAQVELIPQ
jgi:hypothetical protein